jgi:hypothetical protein
MKIAHREAFDGPGLLDYPTAAEGNPATVVLMVVDPGVCL